MTDRCPSARFVAIARLPDHRLAFTRMSRKRKCGVADAVQCGGSEVWGAIYEIPEAEVRALDASEGYQPDREKNSYWRRECVVLEDGTAGKARKVQTYFATPERNPPLPNQEYKDCILAGARRWSLPHAYIADLERIEVQQPGVS